MSSIPSIPPPERRRLRVYAFDPMASQVASPLLGSAAENEVVLDIEHEPLEVGPMGRRIAVVDYDATRGCYYPSVNLDDPSLLAQDGLAPTEGDPRFHQQMVYAVAMKTIENFDRALGRRVRFTNRRQGPFGHLDDRLCILPHAFEEPNAYFEETANAVVFGYFTAESEPGAAFIPDQTVFTCLSADVIAHEVTHSLVHRLRPRFMEPTNPDVAGFHEGFSDVVAIFQHFTYPDLLRSVIARTQGAIDQPGFFVDLAQQFGHGRGDGAALRTAIAAADPAMYQNTEEEHDLGAILVAAVFDAFFQAYRQRTADLLGGGLGREGSALPPGVLQRVAQDAESIAQQFLTMCIRAFEYLPTVDITFGDFLRAAVTADLEINGASTRRNRELLIDGFRRRGIYADDVTSLSEASLRWMPAERGEFPDLPNKLIADLLITAQEVERGGSSSRVDHGDYAAALNAYAKANAKLLGLKHGPVIRTAGFHSSFHVSRDGQLRPEIVVRFEQTEKSDSEGGLAMTGGTTVIAGADGKVRYMIPKPLVGIGAGAHGGTLEAAARRRRDRTRAFVDRWDRVDASLPWVSDAEFDGRMVKRLELSRLHAARGGR